MNCKLLIVIVFLSLSQAVFSEGKHSLEIFKCVNKKGDVFYNDKPCPIKDKETRIKSDKDSSSKSSRSVKSPRFYQKTEKKVFNSSKKVVVDELKGMDKAIHEQVMQQERSNLFTGASDAVERKAALNDSYGNPLPEGYRKPAGSDMKTQKMTEAKLDIQMEKRITRDKLR